MMADILVAIGGWTANDARDDPETTLDLLLEAHDEIKRLRAGGCARDQRTTQFCAEAVNARAAADEYRASLTGALEVNGNLQRELERVKVALANALSERDALRAALLRIEHMDEGCGGNLTDREIWRQMQAVAGAARNVR